jgi:hypothetical protein
MLRLALALLLVGVAAEAETPARLPAASAKCPDPEFRQFDFWLGDWDTFEADNSTPASVARARVDPIAGGCAVHELYEQIDGLVGDSILSFDPVRKVWQQTWVTNRGSIMVLTGAFKDGAVTLEGEMHLRDGKTLLQRITWKAEGSNVRESAVFSKDGGKTWAPAFDVVFKKRH